MLPLRVRQSVMGKVHAKISQGIRLTIPASSPDDMMLMGRKKSARAGCACCAAEARVAERGGPCSIIRGKLLARWVL